MRMGLGVITEQCEGIVAHSGVFVRNGDDKKAGFKVPFSTMSRLETYSKPACRLRTIINNWRERGQRTVQVHTCTHNTMPIFRTWDGIPRERHALLTLREHHRSGESSAECRSPFLDYAHTHILHMDLRWNEGADAKISPSNTLVEVFAVPI